MNESERLAYERPNADRHIDFTPFLGQVVTLTYHSDRAPGNSGLAAGTLTEITENGDPVVTTVDHGSIIVPVFRALRIKLRDPHLPQFI